MLAFDLYIFLALIAVGLLGFAAIVLLFSVFAIQAAWDAVWRRVRRRSRPAAGSDRS